MCTFRRKIVPSHECIVEYKFWNNINTNFFHFHTIPKRNAIRIIYQIAFSAQKDHFSSARRVGEGDPVHRAIWLQHGAEEETRRRNSYGRLDRPLCTICDTFLLLLSIDELEGGLIICDTSISVPDCVSCFYNIVHETGRRLSGRQACDFYLNQ